MGSIFETCRRERTGEAALSFVRATLVFVATACLLTATSACAQTARQTSSGSSSEQQQSAPQAPNTAQKNAAPQSSSSGRRRYEIRPESLPPPDLAEGAAVNGPRLVPRPAGAQFDVPPGFTVETYAEGDFTNPRWMALAPNGDVFVADSKANQIQLLRDSNNDGRVDSRHVFATGLNQPFGMAFWRDYFYVANTDSVVRFPYRAGQTRAEGQPEKIADLPGRGYNQHWTRNLIFRPDGQKMYVTVGSETNVSVEAEPMRAAITEFNPDGTGKRLYAGGLRNPVGLAFQPGTTTLWTSVNERDRLGDDLVPDYLTSVRDGAFYGWPYAYIGQNIDPRRRGERPELVRQTVVPDVLIQAHSAALGLVFYEGAMFPEEYRGDAFVALRGSWNRTRRTGYKIIRVPFRGGRAVGGYEDFVVGWLMDEQSDDVWGRPVGLLLLKDGSMLITDDGANKIWRVSYKAPK